MLAQSPRQSGVGSSDLIGQNFEVLRTSVQVFEARLHPSGLRTQRSAQFNLFAVLLCLHRVYQARLTMRPHGSSIGVQRSLRCRSGPAPIRNRSAVKMKLSLHPTTPHPLFAFFRFLPTTRTNLRMTPETSRPVMPRLNQLGGTD